VKDKTGEIERIICDDKTGRGIKNIVVPGDVERAALSLLESEGTVFITTGLYISDRAVCTDGPSGAVALAEALYKLGRNAVLVEDGPSKPIIQCALDTAGLDIPVVLFPISGREAFAGELINEYQPSHIIAIERTGPARDGRYYDMKGRIIAGDIGHMDVLFRKADEMGITTIGMGDEGNEIGMGKVYDSVVKAVPHGEKIACVIPADYLVVSGIANWAAHGVCACMSLITGKNLMMEEKDERRLLEKLVGCGAVDAYTHRKEITIDSLETGDYFEVINRLRRIVKQHLGE